MYGAVRLPFASLLSMTLAALWFSSMITNT